MTRTLHEFQVCGAAPSALTYEVNPFSWAYVYSHGNACKEQGMTPPSKKRRRMYETKGRG
jgi:hypothetical protein